MLNLAVAMILSQGSISTDPRLSERIRFDAPLSPLGKFIETARASCGVSLSIDPSLEYLKIDAFVDDQPLGVTLSKVSEVFRLEWQKDGDGYKLVPNNTAYVQQKAYIADEDTKVVEVVNHDIAVYREIDRLVPRSNKPWQRVGNRFEGWEPARDKALTDLEKAQDNKDSADKIESLQVRYDALKQISGGLPNLQVARLFGLMNAGDVAQLRSGIPFIASNQANARFKYSLGDIRPNPAMPVSTSVKSVLIARIDPDSHRIGSKEMTFLGNQTGMAPQPASHYPFEDITPFLSKRPFALSLKEWDQSSEFQTSFSRPLKIDPSNTDGDPSPWYEKRQRLGDHLRWFHMFTGVPVIAQADRVAHPFIKSYRQSKNQGEYLTKLLKACNGFGRKSDDFLLVRDGVFWRKSTQELPEEVLSRFEHPKNGRLSFDDYASLAANITHTQAMLLEDSKGFVLKFPRFRFAESYPALRFVSSLDEEQIQIAMDPKSVLTFNMLNDVQRRQFGMSLIDGITGHGFVSDPLLDYLIQGGFSVIMLPGMKFSIRGLTMKTSTYISETVVENGQEIELAPKLSFANRPTKDFKFESFDLRLSLSFLTEDLGF